MNPDVGASFEIRVRRGADLATQLAALHTVPASEVRRPGWVGTCRLRFVHGDRLIVVLPGESIDPLVVELVPEDAREPLEVFRARQRIEGDAETRAAVDGGGLLPFRKRRVA